MAIMTYMGIGTIMMKIIIINFLILILFTLPVHAGWWRNPETGQYESSYRSYYTYAPYYGYGYNPYYYNYGKGFRFYVAPQWQGYYNYQPRIYRYYRTPYGTGVYEW
jgi:hypothetical protein